MRRRTRLAAGFILAIASVLLWAPTVYGRDSTITITMTLTGPVDPDLAFEVVTSPGFGGSNMFCIGKGWSVEDFPYPRCRSGVSYRTKIVLAPGESIDYEVHWILPRRAGPVLWSGNLDWDGRDHRLDYGFTFGLPATETSLDTAPGVDSRPGRSVDGSPIAVLIAAGLGALSSLRRSRRRTVAWNLRPRA
jgi:hypothetical protein